ncbi:MAG: isochorismate synthase [Polyangiaceae bacterium]
MSLSVRTLATATNGPEERLEARFLATLEAALRADPRLVVLTLPAAVVPPELVFGCHPMDAAYHFATGDFQGDVGLGEVMALSASDLADLSRLEATAEHLLEHCFTAGLDVSVRSPRFFGGFTFGQAPTLDGPWREFPRVWFHLPRFRYITDGERASLSIALLGTEIRTREARRNWFAQTRDVRLSIASAIAPPSPTRLVVERRETPSPADWLGLVRDACEAMRTGPLEKVVLAREVCLRFDSPPNAVSILTKLGELAPETTRFALRRGAATFLGATPERLVLRLGSEIRTEALAGSIRVTDVHAEEQLESSDKDRHEHQLVVAEILRKLHALGAKTEHPARPRIRQLRHVLHLSTPITARLFGPPHVLSLATRLHPTPAVGGVPEPLAVEHIRRGEGFERGLYAGGIGWFDAAGDGEFLVALRSGLLEGDTLRLFAGAGIVPSSDPESEFDETQAKLESLLEAIGAKSAPQTSTT